MSSFQPGHQAVMIHCVEELLQVHVHHPLLTALDVPLGCPHCIVRTPPRSKAVAGFAELRVVFLAQYLVHRLLNQSVLHCRYTQLPLPSIRLRDHHPFHRTRFVFPRIQLRPDCQPVRFQVGGQLFHSHPIHPRRTFVGFHSA